MRLKDERSQKHPRENAASVKQVWQTMISFWIILWWSPFFSGTYWLCQSVLLSHSLGSPSGSNPGMIPLIKWIRPSPATVGSASILASTPLRTCQVLERKLTGGLQPTDSTRWITDIACDCLDHAFNKWPLWKLGVVWGVKTQNHIKTCQEIWIW